MGRVWETQAGSLDDVGDLDEEWSNGGGNLLSRNKVKRTGSEHGAREVTHEGTGLEMQVAENAIGAPAADKLNDTGVDATTEQGHGAVGTARSSGNVVGIETKLRAQESGRGPDGFGYKLGGNGAPRRRRCAADYAQRGVGRGRIMSKVADAVDNTSHWTCIWVAGPGVADNLATDTVFLGSKGEGDERDAIQVGDVTSERINASVANEQLDVAEPKWVAFTRTTVLAGPK
jgi:hypothetical protein